MSLLKPLGLLGLLALLVLILIYLIKPNYQQKLVSSTFIWKLSLKYRKRNLPISKLRNILILLCQILILVSCAFILTEPIVSQDGKTASGEQIVIIDASASMRATDEKDEMRFTRAVDETKAIVNSVFDKNGAVSVIVAGKTAEYIAQRAKAESRAELLDKLDALKTDDVCTYGSADIDGAMTLAGYVTGINPDARIVLMTGKQFTNTGNVEVRDVSRKGSEFNVAVLDCRTELSENNYYKFYIDLACYGMDREITVNMAVSKVNIDKSTVNYVIDKDPLSERADPIRLTGNRVVTLEIDSETFVGAGGKATPIFTYESVRVSVQVDDAISEDNTFVLYGGTKPVLNVQYYSPESNSFFSAAFLSLHNAIGSRYNVITKEVRGDDIPALSGFDLYVFENTMPNTVPTDGVVFLVNPRVVPGNLKFSIGNVVNNSIPTAVAPGVAHPITSGVNASNIEVTRYSPISHYDASEYTPLWYCGGAPVLLCKNENDSKIAVMTFSVNFSSAVMKKDFPTMIYNMVNYYVPSAFDKYVYNVGASARLNSRGPTLDMSTPVGKASFDVFPLDYELLRAGVYSVEYTPISNIKMTESFYVRLPADESNILRNVGVLKAPTAIERQNEDRSRLIVYFAAILVTLLFAEWILNSRTRV